jgi:1-phosphofructokinase family hexose kinase
VITTLLLSPSLDVTYLVDRVEEGQIHRPHTVLRLPGGKGLNFARAAARLGGAVRVVTPLGGEVGALVARLAADAGVELIPVSAEPQTRTCVTVAADDDGRLTEIYEAAPPLDAVTLTRLETAAGGLPAGGWTVLSGSVPTGVPLDSLLGMLTARAAAGDRIAVDSHGSALDAVVRRLRPALVKLNRLEAAELLGMPQECEALELATAVREVTGGIVVVTDGASGAVATDAAGSWRAHPHPRPGRFAVGSGDSFLAGLLVALERGEDLPAALVLASAAGAANAAVPGAAEFGLDDVESSRSLVTVTRA